MTAAPVGFGDFLGKLVRIAENVLNIEFFKNFFAFSLGQYFFHRFRAKHYHRLVRQKIQQKIFVMSDSRLLSHRLRGDVFLLNGIGVA